jgi:hypothetical protein
MSDLQELIRELSDRKMTRKQFLTLIGGSLLGTISIFRLLQSINTPEGADLAHSHRGVFGEHEYGHPETADIARRRFDEEVFG